MDGDLVHYLFPHHPRIRMGLKRMFTPPSVITREFAQRYEAVLLIMYAIGIVILCFCKFYFQLANTVELALQQHQKHHLHHHAELPSSIDPSNTPILEFSNNNKHIHKENDPNNKNNNPSNLSPTHALPKGGISSSHGNAIVNGEDTIISLGDIYSDYRTAFFIFGVTLTINGVVALATSNPSKRSLVTLVRCYLRESRSFPFDQ